MLVLTRKPGESFLIGDLITVTYLDGRGGAARIGVDAPRDLLVIRTELLPPPPASPPPVEYGQEISNAEFMRRWSTGGQP